MLEGISRSYTKLSIRNLMLTEWICNFTMLFVRFKDYDEADLVLVTLRLGYTKNLVIPGYTKKLTFKSSLGHHASQEVN